MRASSDRMCEDNQKRSGRFRRSRYPDKVPAALPVRLGKALHLFSRAETPEGAHGPQFTHTLSLRMLFAPLADPRTHEALTWGCGSGNFSCLNSSGTPLRPHSQQGEDVALISNLFCDVCREQRIYLEIGALDGAMYSNTLALENGYNWGGLLIEGLPANARSLIANRGKSGRNVIFNEGICSGTGTVNFTNNPHVGTAGVPELMSKEYLKSWGRRFRHGTVVVPCRPLSKLLQLAGIQKIDFFSLDVEGAELQ
eukprot:2693421-Prymnesium_polylepis.1